MASAIKGRTPRTTAWEAGSGLGWRPRTATFATLGAAAAVAIWLFSPVWWIQIGQDSGVYYAAAVVARQGGDPYDSKTLAATEQRLSGGGAQARAVTAGYANPPLFTLAMEPLSMVPPRIFWGVLAATGVAAGLAGLEALLAAVGWRSRALARTALLISPPFILAAFLGNASPYLLGIMGIAVLCLRRDRPWLAGGVLAFAWLKPSVGLPIAMVVLLLGPGRRGRASAGFALGSALLLGLDVALTGLPELVSWGRLLAGYGIDPAAAARSSAALTESGLAGLPALFAHIVGGLRAELLSVGIVGGILGLLAMVPGWRQQVMADGWLRLAIGVAAVLLVLPFSHLNDLVIAALPLLIVAARPLTVASRLALAACLVGPAGLLLLQLLVLQGPLQTAAGTGLVLDLLVFVAALAAGFQEPRKPVSWLTPQP